MKYFKIALLFILLSAVSGLAQISVGVQGGLAFSAFEDHDGKSFAIPIGVRAGTTILPLIEVGGEFSILLKPFSFDDAQSDDDFDVTQTIIGVYGKYDFPLPALTPYARLGLGYYMGGWEQGKWDGDFDGAIGFNLGAGVNTLMGVYGEFVYHIVSRKADWPGAESRGSNNWGFHVGYIFEF